MDAQKYAGTSCRDSRLFVSFGSNVLPVNLLHYKMIAVQVCFELSEKFSGAGFAEDHYHGALIGR